MSKAPNVDRDLECAMAAEAVYAYERYMVLGVSPDDFATTEPKWVIEAAAEAWEVDGVVNLETVCKALQRVGRLVRVGGADGLAALLAAPGVADVDRLVALRRLRSVRDAALKVVVAADQGDLHASLAALGEAQTTAIDSGRARAIDGYELGVKMLEQFTNRSREESLVHPGFEIMEEALGSLPLGGMTVVGGATNVGKSSFALGMMIRAAFRNVTCGYVSCEDPADVVSSRLVSDFSGVSSRKLMTGKVNEDEWHAVTRAYGPLANVQGRMWFAFAIGGTEIDVCAAMSRCAMNGAKIVIVDYVQAIESSKRQQDRRNEVRWLCARLKAHAQKLNVHLVLLSQLARPTKGSEGKEPTKHDLKEAGDLENAAEYIVLIWRDREDDMAEINAKLAKSKIGNVGARWQLARNGRTGRLEEVEGSYKSAGKLRQDGQL